MYSEEFKPDYKEECSSCIHASPKHCPCKTVEVIELSDEEMTNILRNIFPDDKRN